MNLAKMPSYHLTAGQYLPSSAGPTRCLLGKFICCSDLGIFCRLALGSFQVNSWVVISLGDTESPCLFFHTLFIQRKIGRLSRKTG